MSAVSLAGAATATASEADPFEAEQEVSSATLRSQPLSEVPASVTVITRDDIRDFGFRTLAEALTSVRGFFVSSDRNYSYLGMRGFGPMGDWGSRVLILIDGHPIVGSIYRDSPIGHEFPVDVDAIERIEVVRGPGSAFYGTNAVFGVVNVVTRNAGEGPGADVRVSSDKRGSGFLETGRAPTEGGWSWLVHGAGFGGRGPDLYLPEYDVAPYSDGWARGADGERGGTFVATAERPDWSFRLAASRRLKEIPTGAYETTFNDDRNRTLDRWFLASLDHLQRLGALSAIQGRFTVVGDGYSGDYVYDTATPDSSSFFKDSSRGVAAGLDLRGLFQPTPTVRLAAGVDNQWHFTARQKGWYESPYELVQSIDKPYLNHAAYGLVEWQPRPVLSTSLGLRIEHDSHFGVVTNPRFGAVWQVAPRYTVKAVAGRAYRAPNLYELFYNDATTSRPNPDLGPEVIWTWEGSVEARLGSGVAVSATAFRNNLDQWIGVTAGVDSLLVYGNHGELQMNGAEFELSGLHSSGLRWKMSYTLSHPEGVGEGAMPGFARHVGQAQVVVPFRTVRSRMGLHFRAVGPRYNYGGRRIPGYGIIDLTTGSDLTRRVQLSVSLKNALDQASGDPGGEEHAEAMLPGPGRALEMSLGVRLR